jgi:hypothetical protein
VQLRFAIDVPSACYVNEQSWQKASLERCPVHPEGGCGFARHGTYPRVNPPGSLIARWYCPQAHQTFSLLPDCFAARLSGTLDELEAAVAHLEQVGTQEAAVATLRIEIDLPGALRWLRLRTQAVYSSLVTLKGLLPELLGDCQPTVASFAQHLGGRSVLMALRAIGGAFLGVLPTPLGFRPRRKPSDEAKNAYQQSTGTDPPRA